MKTLTLFSVPMVFAVFNGLLTSNVDSDGGNKNPNGANQTTVGLQGKSSPREESYAKVSKVINRRLKRYDKNVRPNDTGAPVEVQIEFKVVAFGKIREEDMDYTIDIFFRQWWNDPRLAHGVEKVFNGAIDPTKLRSGLWTPDTYFRNVKSSNYHSISRENMRLRIAKDGSIYFSARITLTAQCDMDLSLFPLDTQHCDLIIESYAYTVADVTYQWRNNRGNSVEVFATGMAQFDLISIVTSKKASTNSKGSFDSLKATFTLKRRSTYFIFQHFIPSAFVVFLSWLSFWIDRDAVPARVSLVITCILTSMVLFKSINSSLPRISYLKAVDYYLITSFVFIVSSMVEFVYVLNYPDKKSSLPRCQSFVPTPRANHSESSITVMMDHPNHRDSREQTNYANGSLMLRKGFFTQERLNSLRPQAQSYEGIGNVEKIPSKQAEPHYIDRYARKLFPLLYGLFNIVYWSYYLPRS